MTQPRTQTPSSREAVTEALRLLGIDKLVLAIHDPSFPSAPGRDTGRGTPYGAGGLAFLRHARELGFTGLQLGPQGRTSLGNQSPYDGTLFSRNVLSLDLEKLVADPAFAGLVRDDEVAALIAGNPRRDTGQVAHEHVYEGYHALLARAAERFSERRQGGDPRMHALAAELDTFRARHRAWLERDGLFEVLTRLHGHAEWRRWPGLDTRLFAPAPGEASAAASRRAALGRSYGAALEGFALGQLMIHGQHAAFQAQARELGLDLYGDLQIGVSQLDAWAYREAFLDGYLLGGPPSRTNPAGQPWNLPVLDPDRYLDADGGPGPGLRLVGARLGKMLAEFDGVRIDHPHGLVCPWVYDASDPDPFHAVQHGARLFESPDLPDHPALARHARVRPEQLDRAAPRYADGWVRSLDDDQVAAYGKVLETLLAAAAANGRQASDVLCEVLSTQPLPLARVMARHGMGRFRVTQKANLAEPADVYRGENADPADWIMTGNHDTPPIWRVVGGWMASGEAARQAEYLARRLRPDDDPGAFAARLSRDPGALVHAKVADLFVGPARNVMIFFPDLLGLTGLYNAPGTVNEENWTLRVPQDWAERHRAGAAEGTALDLPRSLAWALRSRGTAFARAHAGLIGRLEAP